MGYQFFFLILYRFDIKRLFSSGFENRVSLFTAVIIPGIFYATFIINKIRK